MATTDPTANGTPKPAAADDVRERFRVNPTPVRLDSHPHYDGRGITIALLDSGFQKHPDLTQPKNRILAFIDANTGEPYEPGDTPSPFDWHGTQTSVAAAGNGYQSEGRYKGVASGANVVLVRIGDRGRISDAHIARGIEWVINNRKAYNIQVANVSAGGDAHISVTESIADQAAEEAVRQGIVMTAAAGNAGHTSEHLPMPPANAPSVVTVGGYDDKNRLSLKDVDLYRSSFGATVDGLLKPELIAPAVWVAAPILEGTDQVRASVALWRLLGTPDQDLQMETGTLEAEAGLPKGTCELSPERIRAVLEERVTAEKIVGPRYQHVDGTSFAAPVVASVVAQMLDANPDLKPHAVKHILLSTADRLAGASVIRQGYGILNARRAVEQALRSPGGMPDKYFRPPHRDGDDMVFYFLDASAQSVALAGKFNDWNPAQATFVREPNGVWSLKIPYRPYGAFPYKLVVDGNRWIEDPNNWLKEDDGMGSLSSVLYLE